MRNFAPLLEPSRYKAAWGGRGSAKSWFFADLLVDRALCNPGTRAVCIREVQRSLRQSVKQLIEDRIRYYNLQSMFRVMSDCVVTPGDGIVLFQGMQDHTAETIKSLERMNIAYVEEAQTITSRSLELLRPTIRDPGSELWFAWNPRSATDPVDEMFRGSGGPPPRSIIVQASYRDNLYFPAELEEERQYDYSRYPDRYAHIWEGEYEPSAAGALWDRATIHRNRRSEAPTLNRILVSIDPPIATADRDKQDTAEAGIIVGGIGEDGRGYIIDDVSIKGTPQQWGERAIAAYDLYDADAIIAEVNQGGEMVRHVLHSVRPGVRVITVHATRGKHVRAEPIASLYGLDRISHVGAYPELEAQLCLFTAAGYQGNLSPDRADAAIWLFTELFPKMIRHQKDKAKPMPTRANSHYSPHRARTSRGR